MCEAIVAARSAAAHIAIFFRVIGTPPLKLSIYRSPASYGFVSDSRAVQAKLERCGSVQNLKTNPRKPLLSPLRSNGTAAPNQRLPPIATSKRPLAEYQLLGASADPPISDALAATAQWGRHVPATDSCSAKNPLTR